MTTDLVEAAQIALQQSTDVQALVGAPGLIGVDDVWVNGWIFARKLWTRIENTERCAIVVNTFGGAPATPGNTFRYPILVVDVFADPTRDDAHNPQLDDAEVKANKVYAAIFKVLHIIDRSGANVSWGGMRVISSDSAGEPDILPVADGNGLVRLRARFEISY